MANMTKFSKKSGFPAQVRGRHLWIIEAVREHQQAVAAMLHGLLIGRIDVARDSISGLHKSDRDAILCPGGILTDKQIEALTKKPDGEKINF